jgi:hypothetical protein
MKSFIYLRLLVILTVMNSICFPRFAQQSFSELDTVFSQISDSNIDVLFETGGTFNAVCGQGNTVYVNEGRKLIIFDVTDPGNPITLAVTDELTGNIDHLFYSEGIVYAITKISSLWMIDVSVPTDPQIIGDYQSPWNITGVFISNKIAYLTYLIIGINFDQSGLATVDVHDPADPNLLDTIEFPVQGPMIYTTNPYVSGNYAYIAGLNAGFWIVDVSEPGNLESMIVKFVGNIVISLVIQNRSGIETAYIGTGSDGLFIYDVSNPQVPQSMGAINFNGWSNDISVAGDVAYIAGGDTGLTLINIHDSNNPSVLSNYDFPELSIGLYVNNNIVSLVNDSGGFELLNVTNPANIFETFTFSPPTYSIQTFVSGNLGLIADDQALYIYDAENPRSLKYISKYRIKNLSSVIAQDGIAYLGNSAGDLIVLDIKNPAQPTLLVIKELAITETPGGISDVAIYDGYLFLANGEAGLRIFDLTDPKNPEEKLVYNPESWNSIIKMDFADNYLYLSDWSFGIRVVDCTDPLQPYEIGHLGGLTNPNAIFIRDDIAYLAAGSSGLKIIDISNPQSPSTINTYPTENSTVDIQVYGILAYLTDGNRITILNISNITQPQEVGNYTSSNPITSLYRDKCVLYSTEWGGGIKSLVYVGGEETCNISGLISNFRTAESETIVHLSNGISVSPDSNGFYSFTVPIDSSINDFTLTIETKRNPVIPESRQVAVPPDATDQNFTIILLTYMPSIHR